MEDYLLNNDEIEKCFRSKPLKYPSPYTLNELIDKTIKLNAYNKPIHFNSTIALVGNSGNL